MKLNTYLFILIFTILACSNESADDGNNNNGNFESDGVLISSITSSEQNSDYQYVSYFTYDGTKIVSRTDTSYYNGSQNTTYIYTYTYTDNKISLIQSSKNHGGDSNYYSYEEFLYNSQGMVSEIRYFDNCDGSNSCDLYDSYSVEYNSNGSISVTYNFDNDGDGVNDGYSIYTYNIDNSGNLISGSRLTESDDNCEYSFSSQYDNNNNNNNPVKNITGSYNLGIFAGSFLLDGSYSWGTLGLTKNPNIVTYLSDGCDNSENNYTDIIEYAYDYNEAGYPRNIIVDITETYGSDTYTGEEIITIEYN